MNNSDINSGLPLLCLTAEGSNDACDEEEDDDIYWLDDNECQENLGTLLALGTEECMIDTENHIQSLNKIHLFFQELGVLTEEPEPIDPNCNYNEQVVVVEHCTKPIPSLHSSDTSTVVTTVTI